MTEIAIALLWLFAQVTIVLLAVVGVYALSGRAAPRVRAAVLSTGLSVTMVLTLLAFSPWPNWWPRAGGDAERSASPSELRPASVEETAASAGDSGGTAQDGEAGDGAVPAVPDTELESPWAAFATGFVESIGAPRPVDVPDESQPWWPVVVVSLFGGAAGVGLLRMLAGWRAVRRLRVNAAPIDDARLRELLDVVRAETGCRRAVDLRASESIGSAATFGWLRPVVLLACDWRSWSEDELRAVLAHELAHVQRGDFLSLLWTELGVLLHFYHPLMHWLGNRTRLEHELAADAVAARTSGGPQPYLRLLAEIVLREPDRRTSWSVATFLPTRRTFLRRIEVLRETRATRRAGWGTLTAAMLALVGTGLAVAGLRGPGAVEQSADDPGVEKADIVHEDDGGASSSDGLDLSYLPRDVPFLYQFDVASLLQASGSEKLTEQIAEIEGEQKTLGVPLTMVRRLSLTLVPPEHDGERRLTAPGQHPLFVVHTTQDVTSEMLKEQGGYEPARTVEGVQLFESGRNVIALPAPRTVVYSSNASAVLYAVSQGENGAEGSVWAGELKRVANADVVLFGNVAAFRREMGDEFDRQFANSGLGLLAPTYRNTNVFVAGASLDEQLRLKAFTSCTSADAAKKVAETAGALIVLGRNWVEQARLADLQRAPRNVRPALDEILKRADELLASLEVEQKQDLVEVTGQTKDLNPERIVAVVLPAIRDARTAARQAASTNNLKQLAIAMHNYHDQHGRFPPAVLTGPDGKTKYSWRIALLPYLEQAKLYEEYDRTQPWDSAHNKRVLAKMPGVYRDPHEPKTGTNASYFALTGKGTVFDGGQGTRLVEITDGTSNTIMLVSAKRKIPWTKPEDIEVDLSKKLPKLGGYYDDVFLAVHCDGSVRAIAHAIDAKVLELLISKADGQPLPSF